MAYATATFADVRSFEGPAFAFGDVRRIVFGPLAGLLATFVGACAMAAAVVFAAAWTIGIVLSINPGFHGRAPLTPEMTALAGKVSGTTRFAGIAPALPREAYARDLAMQAELQRAVAAAQVPLPPKRIVARADDMPAPSLPAPDAPVKHAAPASNDLTHVAKLSPAPVTAAPPLPVAPPAPKPSPQQAKRVPLPPRRPPDAPQVAATHEIARASAGPATPPLVTGSLPPHESLKQITLEQALDGTVPLPAPHSRVAIYDIAAHTVYLPTGERLEAHSGLGYRLDDPRYAHQKMRGPTPPNIYDLTLRSHLFHGVRAIRLNPVDDDKMFGRDGMLAHTYMLGHSGQSFGCVSFKHYRKFLQAFLDGKIDRLVVVPRLKQKPRTAQAGGNGGRYALN